MPTAPGHSRACGQTSSCPARIANGPGELQFTDIAVGPDGAVYVTYRSTRPPVLPRHHLRGLKAHRRDPGLAIRPGYDPDLPPGNTASGQNSGDVVEAFAATSTDGGETWTESPTSSAGSNPNWEVRGLARSPFIGDYNYAGAIPGRSYVTWTDTRDLVPGSDPRGMGEGRRRDTSDGFQECDWVPDDINAASYDSPTIDDYCLSQGVFDQNIYVASGP